MLNPALTDLRRRLHRHPELSGAEGGTARAIAEALAPHGPDLVREGLGGAGVAAVWEGVEAGPTVLLRADLDALPIDEGASAVAGAAHASSVPGVAHKCGHDGHMAMVAGVAPRLAAERPARGRAILLFQPAEETGAGARAVLDDAAFADLVPDHAVALHNLPGRPLAQVCLRDGTFASASRGLELHLTGATSHAAEPEAGRSPALALAALVQAWSALPEVDGARTGPALVTVVHARLGERAFGTSPGEAVLAATLRAHDDAVVERLTARCLELARAEAEAHGLALRHELVEPFPATQADPAINAVIEAVAVAQGLEVARLDAPLPWSEDFGHFTSAGGGALFGLGSGLDQPALHHPDYDFPDALLGPGAALFEGVLRALLAGEGA